MKSAEGRAERGYRSGQREGPPAVAMPAPGAPVGDDPIQALVDGRWPDPDGGAPIGVPIESIVIERSLAGSEADLVRNLGFGGHVAIVFDAATEAALGRRVAQALAGRVELTEVRLPRDVQADVAAVDRLRIATSTVDALVAVGSGTINDVCKYAAAQDDKPYAVFATAPSMNGYASGNAAITVDGHKHTLAARAPKGVFVDLEVLAAAPPRLIRAGIGDSLCRPTAQVDWRLSHEVHGTRYRTAPFALLAPDEPNWRDDPEAVMEGDLDAMRALARTLILSGLGMTLCQGSYPASQGEHLVSHYIDMFAPAARAPYLHGEQVAVATLALARLQERMLDAPAPAVRASTESRATFVRRFGEEIGASCWTGFAAKALAPPDAAVQSERIAKAWPRIVDTLSRMAVPAQLLETALRRAGAPTTPAHIGLTPAFFAKAVREARFLRDRYTFLDLAGDAGTLDFAATN